MKHYPFGWDELSGRFTPLGRQVLLEGRVYLVFTREMGNALAVTDKSGKLRMIVDEDGFPHNANADLLRSCAYWANYYAAEDELAANGLAGIKRWANDTPLDFASDLAFQFGSVQNGSVVFWSAMEIAQAIDVHRGDFPMTDQYSFFPQKEFEPSTGVNKDTPIDQLLRSQPICSMTSIHPLGIAYYDPDKCEFTLRKLEGARVLSTTGFTNRQIGLAMEFVGKCNGYSDRVIYSMKHYRLPATRGAHEVYRSLNGVSPQEAKRKHSERICEIEKLARDIRVRSPMNESLYPYPPINVVVSGHGEKEAWYQLRGQFQCYRLTENSFSVLTYWWTE